MHIVAAEDTLRVSSLQMAALPKLPPLSEGSVKPSFPNDPLRQKLEGRRTSWSSLALLADTSFNSYVPYGWGFTIYRIRFAGDSDERFTRALQRLTTWIKWLVRASRYIEEGVRDLFPGDVIAPLPPAIDDPTDHIADRLVNEVIEFTPRDGDSEPEGEEDFSAVGRTFSDWVASLDVDFSQSRNNARYDHCLIIDEKALKSLELLPEDMPPLEHRKIQSPYRAPVVANFHNSWVWVLDRKANEALLEGEWEEAEHPPWLRLRISLIMTLWFERAKGTIPLDWLELREEDKHNWETVGWWNPQAIIANGVLRLSRGEDPPFSSSRYNT